MTAESAAPRVEGRPFKVDGLVARVVEADGRAFTERWTGSAWVRPSGVNVSEGWTAPPLTPSELEAEGLA